MSGYRIVEKPNGAIGGQTVFYVMSPGGLVAASVIGSERRGIAEAVLQMVESMEQKTRDSQGASA